MNVGLVTSSRVEAQPLGESAHERRLARRRDRLTGARTAPGASVAASCGASARCLVLGAESSNVPVTALLLRRPPRGGARSVRGSASPMCSTRSPAVIDTSPSSASASSPAAPCRYTADAGRPPRRRAAAPASRRACPPARRRCRRSPCPGAGGIDEHLAVRRRDQRPVALEHDVDLVALREVARRCPSRFACTSSTLHADQPRHLARDAA